jgi:multidrug efflux system membrane fusion protein
MTVIFAVPQTQLQPILARLQAGATLTASAYSSDDTTKIADGTLTAVGNQVNTSTGTVNFRATFPNTDNALFPNEFVNIHLLVDTIQNATLVPSQAVQTGAPGSYVYVVDSDDTVSVQTVTAGTTDGTNTVITKGLSPGDVVVIDGVDRLADGMKVTIPAGTTPPAGSAPKHHHRHHAWSGGGEGGGQGGGGGPPS